MTSPATDGYELVFDGMHIGFFETKDAAMAEVVLLAKDHFQVSKREPLFTITPPPIKRPRR